MLYGFFQPRTQATIDLVLYVLFFIPGVVRADLCRLLLRRRIAGPIREHSNVTAEGPPIYPFKTMLPLAGAILLAQGIVEIIRCVICIRQGAVALA